MARTGWETMGQRNRDREEQLVNDCLSGSQDAWLSFYQQHIGLVRSIVARRLPASSHDREDVAQEVFASLVSSLRTYDPTYALSKFVAVIAERECIQRHRSATAAKRAGVNVPVDHHDGGEEEAEKLASGIPTQEEQLAGAEMTAMLRQVMRSLDRKCRELLRLKYHDELQYHEISAQLGTPSNTLAVQAKRCMDNLRAAFSRAVRKGVKL